jgi:3',5'-nucleoside bisphosphate phosphatase
MKRKILLLALITFVIHTNGYSQNVSRKIINIPDIEGYKTLKCDFHMHTVFSDGGVWPTVRVEEAWAEGLDVIAITDHLGHHPKNKIDTSEFNADYNIAKPLADKLGIILIKGSEITRKPPYGHYNALFLNDINLIDITDCVDALTAAKNQGAFITWNHPGWKMKDEIPIWDSIPEKLLAKGLINGIEIVNYTSYYPLTLSWAVQKNLTLMSGSDIHDPSNLEFDYQKIIHRPITLVFAKDTMQSSIKEALTDHRTVIYNEHNLYGSKELLKALFKASVTIVNPEFSIDADSYDSYYAYIKLQNNSCIDFEIELSGADTLLAVTEDAILTANSITTLYIKPYPKKIKGDKDFILKYKVKNLYTLPEENVIIELPLKIKFI